ncbi:MAG: hypothetical protein ABI789_12445 [Usitatibacter sp.]
MVLYFLLAFGNASPSRAAEKPREAHGMTDTFAEPGVALAWGVLQGDNESATVIALRIVTDAAMYPWIAASGSDPFTQRQQSLLGVTESAGVVDVRVPRSRFADFPRTELRFYDTAPMTPAATPRLIVFYLGVPDTTPEFSSDAKLDAYLNDRIARMRGSGGKSP